MLLLLPTTFLFFQKFLHFLALLSDLFVLYYVAFLLDAMQDIHALLEELGLFFGLLVVQRVVTHQVIEVVFFREH